MIRHYVDMLADRERVERMAEAIGEVVRPGMVVADLGTGTGAFALFAAKAGARKVYAVENTEVAELTRSMVSANQAGDVVEVVRADATRYRPPEPVDVVIFEDFEDLGVGPTLARLSGRWKELLRPSGRFVPSALRVRIAAVEHPDEHERGFPWPDGEAYGLDVTAMQELSRHARSNCHVREGQLLTEAKTAFELRLGDDLPSRGSWTIEAPVVRGGALHGLALWFDLTLAPGVLWTNEPGPSPTIWRQAFLHTRDAFHVLPTDRLRLRVSHAPWGDLDWHWSWEAVVTAADGTVRHHESRSTFEADPMSVDALRRRSLSAAIPRTRSTEVLGRALRLVDGKRSAREIGEMLSEELPAHFEPPREAALEVARRVLPLASDPESGYR